MMSAAWAGTAAPSPLCPVVPDVPFGWRLDWGLGSGRNEAAAITSAQESARTRLLGAACNGVGALRCAAAERSVAVWGVPAYDKRANSACAAMVIQVDALKSFERDLQRLDADLAALVAAVPAGATIELDPPTWASGCVAGDLGHALATQLRSELGRRGVTVGTGGGRLGITLTPSAERVTVAASLRTAAGEKLLPGFTFPADLYGVSAGEAGRCAGKTRLGLDRARAGANGLEVSLSVPTDDGRMCEGTRATAEVRVNRPAAIEVWSVIHDGRAFLLGPDPALVPGGKLTGGGPVLQFDALALEQTGDEFLVVIAREAAGSLPNAPCRLDRAWTPDRIPADAAVAVRTWSVIPEGTDGCGPWDGAATKTAVVGMLTSIPVCR